MAVVILAAAAGLNLVSLPNFSATEEVNTDVTATIVTIIVVATSTSSPYILETSTITVATPTIPATPTLSPVPTLLPATPTVTPAYPINMVVYNTNFQGAYIGNERNPLMRGKLWPDGTVVIIVGPNLSLNGITWERIKDPDGTVGWMQAEFLIPPHMIPPTATPTQTPTITVTRTPTVPKTPTALPTSTTPGVSTPVSPPPTTYATRVITPSPSTLPAVSPVASGTAAPTATSKTSTAPTVSGMLQTCPPWQSCCIKGDISDKGERLYYLPGWATYNAVIVGDKVGESFFCSEAEARGAGWVSGNNR